MLKIDHVLKRLQITEYITLFFSIFNFDFYFYMKCNVKKNGLNVIPQGYVTHCIVGDLFILCIFDASIFDRSTKIEIQLSWEYFEFRFYNIHTQYFHIYICDFFSSIFERSLSN